MVLLHGCTGLGSGPSEGVIEYEVSYPYMESGGLMAAAMPNKMVMKFKENRYTSNLEAGWGWVKIGFIADNQQRKLQNILKVASEKLAVNLDETETRQLIQDFPEMTIIKTGGIDTIAGYPCKEAIAIYNEASLPDITLYYTDAIDLVDPNWCNQFHEIDGVLLAYEVERYNMRMRFRAVSVEATSVDETEFSIPEDYKLVDSETMEQKLYETLGQFNPSSVPKYSGVNWPSGQEGQRPWKNFPNFSPSRRTKSDAHPGSPSRRIGFSLHRTGFLEAEAASASTGPPPASSSGPTKGLGGPPRASTRLAPGCTRPQRGLPPP